jgi:hypothetical protein
MKLPSISSIFSETARTFKRFPIVLINTIFLVGAALLMTENDMNKHSEFLINIVVVGVIGIPFLTSMKLFIESKKLSERASTILQIAGIFPLIFYAFSLPTNLPDAPHIHMNRFILLALGMHMLVAVAPYTSQNEENGFWHYNIFLFTRFITAWMFSTVLVLGFSAVLTSLNVLFSIHISEKRFIDLSYLAYGLFNTVYFLAGIPEDLSEFEASTVNPKIFKIFAQFILSPILIAYILVLYAYIIKILLLWSWPRGYVSSMIIWFSVIGIFSLLLLYPLKNDDKKSWVNILWRWFFIVMIPLVILLPFAAYQRISLYGFTEERVLLCVITLWLLIMILYFIFSKKKSIKILPASLTVIILLISYGPLSIFSISAHNQAAILRNILERDSILVRGNVSKEHKQCSHADTLRISSILEYLDSEHGINNVQPLVMQSSSPVTLEAFLREFNTFHQYYYSQQAASTISLSSACNEHDVHGYDKFDYCVANNGNSVLQYENQKIQLLFTDNLQQLSFSYSENKQVIDSLRMDFRQIFTALISKTQNSRGGYIPEDKMTFTAEKGKLKIKIFFKEIEFVKTQEKTYPKSLNFYLYYATGRYAK